MDVLRHYVLATTTCTAGCVETGRAPAGWREEAFGRPEDLSVDER